MRLEPNEQVIVRAHALEEVGQVIVDSTTSADEEQVVARPAVPLPGVAEQSRALLVEGNG